MDVVESGEEKTVYSCSGQGAMACLRFYPDDSAGKHDLSHMLIKLYWDGDANPSVEAPIDSFFGAAPGIHPFSCLPISMNRCVFECRFVMPFQNGMKLSLINYNHESYPIHFSIGQVPCVCADKLLRFHAKWHNGFYGNLSTSEFPRCPRWPDWPYGVMARAFCGRSPCI